MTHSYFIPKEEALNTDELAQLQIKKFQTLLDHILPDNPFYQHKLNPLGGDALHIRTLEEFQKLPFTTKEELINDQASNPPYGTNLTYPLNCYSRLHQTSGTSGGRPMRWLDTPESWDWILRCWGIIYRAIGLNPEDRLFFPFSFGPFIGFWSAFEAAAQMGNLVLSGGGMTTAARLHFMLDHQATMVACTPTYALRLAEIAHLENIDLSKSPVRALIVAGEPGGNIPETKQRIEEAWGARCFDHTGMTEVGPLGIECVEDAGNTHLLGSECIYEVIHPESGEALPEGKLGELVLTTLGRVGSPLIRYRTGDLVRLTTEKCVCGRSFARMLGGILGRVDDMLIIRGNNIYPSAVEAVVRRFPEIAEFRIEIKEENKMPSLILEIEPVSTASIEPSNLANRVSNAFQNAFHFRAEIRVVESGKLPRFELKAQRWHKCDEETKA